MSGGQHGQQHFGGCGRQTRPDGYNGAGKNEGKAIALDQRIFIQKSDFTGKHAEKQRVDQLRDSRPFPQQIGQIGNQRKFAKGKARRVVFCGKRRNQLVLLLFCLLCRHLKAECSVPVAFLHIARFFLQQSARNRHPDEHLEDQDQHGEYGHIGARQGCRNLFHNK